MRLRLLVNPVASSMTERRRAAIAAALGARHAVETVLTTARGNARDLARAAADDGVDVVVVAAGDGTLNEAANGLVHTTTALAALPGGSTNVFARAVGFGNRMGRATDRLLTALDRGGVRRVGVGQAADRHFLFHLGAGFDAAIVERMERTPGVKRYAAHPAFALQTLRLLASGYDRRVPAIHVGAPEPAGDGGHAGEAGPGGTGGTGHDSFFTVVSNLAPYTYVGPRRMLLTRAAALGRPLAVTSLTRFTLRDVARAAGSSVGGAARLARDPHVAQLVDVAGVQLTAREPGTTFPWQVDGDYLGTVATLDVRYVPDALSLVLPV